MSDTTTTQIQPNTINPLIATPGLPPGTPIAVPALGDSDTLVAAKANTFAQARAIGVLLGPAPSALGLRHAIRYNGEVTLPTAEWDAITGESGGLAFGRTYYVSAVTAGLLTSAAPTTPDFVCAVGYAVSPTTLFVQPSFPVVGGAP